MIDCSDWPYARLIEEVHRAHRELSVYYKEEYRIGGVDRREKLMAALAPHWRERYQQEAAAHKLTRRTMNAFRDELSDSWWAPSFLVGQRVTIKESDLKGHIESIDTAYDDEPYRVDIEGQGACEWCAAKHLEAGWAS